MTHRLIEFNVLSGAHWLIEDLNFLSLALSGTDEDLKSLTLPRQKFYFDFNKFKGIIKDKS